MGRTGCFLLLLVMGCAEVEVAEQDAPGEAAVSGAAQPAALAAELGGYRCEPMAQAAKVVVPPPAPELNRQAVVPLVRAACPPGQVPFYVEAQGAGKVPVSGPPLPSKSGGVAGVSTLAGTYWYASVMKPTESFNQSGVGARIMITNPAIYDQLDMVTAEISIVRGANYHLVEIGLRKFWDAFPRLMISQWAYGQFNDATGFVRVHNTYAPGMPLSPYYGAAVPHYVRYDAGNWWIWFNDAWVGYFPGSLWAGTFTSGDMAHFYGEVYSAQGRIPPITDMGNGLPASNPGASFMTDMCMHSTTYLCYYLSGGWRYESNPAYYSTDYAGGSFAHIGGNGGG